MTKDSILTDELKKWVGHEFKPVVYEIETGAIRKLAKAIGYTWPLCQDEEYAMKSKYGGIVVPLTFIASLRVPEADEWVMKLKIPQKRIVNAGVEMEIFMPIKTGDVVTVTSRIADLIEREGKSGKMLAMVFEITYVNQRGELAAKIRATGIRF